VLRAYSSLRNDSEGQCLQIRDGKRDLRDGPFAEAREMIGGFFLVDCATRDEAVELAALCPAAEWATIQAAQVALSVHAPSSFRGCPVLSWTEPGVCCSSIAR
jgi:hypothetical protein